MATSNFLERCEVAPGRYYRESISLLDSNFLERLFYLYERDGVVVITDVMTAGECRQTCDDMVAYVEALGSGVDAKRIQDTWTEYNLPPQTRPGLFQALLSNMPAAWAVRSHPNVRRIFEGLYSHLRRAPTRDFIVSNDAITLIPGCVAGACGSHKDWPHLDQTTRDDIFRCIQGQAVLTETLASFVASPGSHRLHSAIIDACGVASDDASDWCKFSDSQARRVRALVMKARAEGSPHIDWQVPVIAPRGSFIVWASATVHSSRLSPVFEPATTDDPYRGWRAVVYVCYLPRTEFSEEELATRRAVVVRNQTTNHWATKVFPKRPGGRGGVQRHPRIEAMLEDPMLVYAATSVVAPLELDAAQSALSGHDFDSEVVANADHGAVVASCGEGSPTRR